MVIFLVIVYGDRVVVYDVNVVYGDGVVYGEINSGGVW